MNKAQQQQNDQEIWNEEAAATDAELNAPGAESAAAPEAPAPAAAEDTRQQGDQQQATAGDPPAADPLQDVPEPVRQAIEKIRLDSQSMVSDLTHQLKSANGRIGAMQRQLEAAAKMPAAANGADPAPSAQEVSAASADAKKWQKLREDFPEWAEGIDELVAHRVGEASKKAAPAVDEQAIRQSAVEAAREAIVEDEHPGWKDTVNTQEFHDWFKTQPEDVQKLANSSRSKDAITLLDKFVGRNAQPAATDIATARRERLERNVTVRSQRGSGGVDASAMTDEQYWDHLARQEGAA